MQKKPLILFAAVDAATASEPKVFNDVCNITLPMAVIEYCKPIGMPTLHRVAEFFIENFFSCALGLNISNFLYMYMRQASPALP